MSSGGEEAISWLLCSPRFLFKLSEGFEASRDLRYEN